MKSRITNWIKGHRRLVVMMPSLVLALVLCLAVLPAQAVLTYLDVTGTYSVNAKVGTTYLDSTRHPNLNFDTLVITTQTDQTISVATLTTLGKTIALTGLVGDGTKPSITLTGTDSVGTQVSIIGRVTKDAAGTATGISGKIQGYVTSDGEKGTDSGGSSTSASSVVAANSGTYSALLTKGTGSASSTYVQLKNPANRIKVSQLDTLTAGRLGFYFNLENAKTPGPQFELRFTSGTYGVLEITVMPYQAPYTGDGTWVECDLTSASTRAVYYGNDPTDGTAFNWETEAGNYTLAEIEALVNAETAMTDGSDSCSNWLLTRVRIELWEAGARTCYVDDIDVGGTVYTLEPAAFSGTFRARISD